VVIVFVGRVWGLLVAGLVSVVVLLVFVAGAWGFVEPGFTGTYADFANCPANVVNGDCVHSVTTSGVVQIGHSVVSIAAPGDTFDMGTGSFEGETQAVCVLAGFSGECAVAPPHGILNGPAQPVPASLLGTVGNLKLGPVSAKLEWATPVRSGVPFGIVTSCGANNLLTTFNLCEVKNGTPGTGITLRVKIHLLNQFLGASCFIGSAASPLVIPLTAGTTTPPPPALPLKGKIGTVNATTESTELLGLVLVSNTFAVPAANGCGTTGGGLLDASLDHKLGLPSPAGQNAMVINGNGEEYLTENVLLNGWTGE
jgi:hypothetical protein